MNTYHVPVFPNCEEALEDQDSEYVAEQPQQAGQKPKLPHPVTTITVNGDDGCNPSGNALCNWMFENFQRNLNILTPVTTFGVAVYSKAHGKGERNRAGKASGSSNEKKKKPRYDPKTKKWWIKDQNGKRQDLGGDFKPTPEDLKRAGLAATGAVAGGITIWTVLETAAEAALAF